MNSRREGDEDLESADIEKLIEEFGKDVYRFCAKLTGNRSCADDLYQQTFLRLLEKKETLKWDSNPKAYLFATANGIYKSDIRKMARRNGIAPCVSLDDEENPVSVAGAENLEEELLRRVQADGLRRAIDGLDRKFQVPLLLFYSFQLSEAEIAKVEKIPQGTVKSRLHKARQLLKKEMEGLGYGYEEVFG